MWTGVGVGGAVALQEMVGHPKGPPVGVGVGVARVTGGQEGLRAVMWVGEEVMGALETGTRVERCPETPVEVEGDQAVRERE